MEASPGLADPADEALSALVSELVLIVTERPEIEVRSNSVASDHLPVDRDRGAQFFRETETDDGVGSATVSVTARRAKVQVHWRGADGRVSNLEERLLLDLVPFPRCGDRRFETMQGLAEAIVERLEGRLDELRRG